MGSPYVIKIPQSFARITNNSEEQPPLAKINK